MRVGIIGAGRIGKFHIREFFGAGCEIVAIFQNKKEKAEENAKILSETYKKPIKPYWNLEKFFKEKLDIVSICTPCEFHSFYIKKSLEKGLNVFSEKPFVFDSEDKNFKIAKRLVELAKEKNKIVSVNTQWACLFNYNFNFPKKIGGFEMLMEPGFRGIGMLKEHLAHMNSILIKLIPNGKANEILFSKKTEDRMDLTFCYSNGKNKCKVRYILNYKMEGVRDVWFKINGKKYTREVSQNYTQKIIFGNEEIKIEDPFKTLIKNFVEAVKNKDTSCLLISNKEILENIKLQDEIIKEYLN